MEKSSKDQNELIKGKKVSRRNFIKFSSLGLAALATAKLTGQSIIKEKSLRGKKLAMVIDLQKCTGCGGCIIVCKNENNLTNGVSWSNKISKTTGKYPNVRFMYIPTLCNHCENAPCVKGCPTGAMHKAPGNITMHNPTKCIGCKTCMTRCPYGVIYSNDKKPQKFWRSEKSLIKDCTPSPKEVTQKANGTVIPYYNPDRERNLKGSGLRYKGIVEKCTLCDHRIKQGKLPYCVKRCPANARKFGDLNDPNSNVSRILSKYDPMRLKEHLGTEPKVFYVRDFNPAGISNNKGKV